MCIFSNTKKVPIFPLSVREGQIQINFVELSQGLKESMTVKYSVWWLQ